MMKMRTRTALIAASAIISSGCAIYPESDTEGTGVSAQAIELQEKERELEQLSSELNKTSQELAEVRAALESSGTQGAMPRADTSLFPPNPKPGECYARVLLPAKYQTSTQQVLKREASERIEIIPAKFGPGTEQVLVKEASTKLTVEPAVYETVTETVMVSPASKKIVEIPAKYETVTERVLDKPAHTIWKRGATAVQTGNVLETSYDQSTGEIMCLVEVPATYKTITKQVLARPASTQEIEIPAKYETITKQILKRPATTREVTIPAEYKTVKTTVMVEPSKERRIPISPEYETVTVREKITDESLVWRRVLCDVNLTANNVTALQRALKDKGYYNGPIDGVIGVQTLGASRAYAEAKGLPSGSNYIPVEVAEALGVKI